jgi:hypothetical protein
MKFFEGLCDLEEFKKRGDDDPSALVFCATVDMAHVRNATRAKCNFCGAAVWLAPSTLVAFSGEITVYLGCPPCLSVLLPQFKALPPTEAQAREFAADTGMTIEEATARMRQIVKAHNFSQARERN